MKNVMDLAMPAGQHRPATTMICIGGAPGAGKSTVGSKVAATLGAALVDLDSVTTAVVEAAADLLGVPPNMDVAPLIQLRAARYRCLGQVAADNLAVGQSVVAVAPFTGEAVDGDRWRLWASERGASSVLLCWLEVDTAVAADRIARRGFTRDRAKAPTSSGSRRLVAGPTVDAAGIDIVIDSSRTDATSIAATIAAAAFPLRGVADS